MRTRRVILPSTARAGEVVNVRAVIQHPMITGHSEAGANTRPRDIIHTFTATYDGVEVFRAELMPGIAANPSVAFTFVATRTADVVLTWLDDKSELNIETRRLTVT
jgi:sulfur-oxidizing protein SoxZ